MEGIVTRSTGSWYDVRTQNGTYYKCRIKGKFRLDNSKHTNPVTVGDKIEFEQEPDLETCVITKIFPRKNYIIRKASNLSKQTHIIASNLDQAVIMATIAYPTTSLGFIDRFLVTAEAYHIPAIIVFNKCDLYDQSILEILNKTIELYQQKIGYRCIKTSMVSGEGIAELQGTLTGKTTLITGHSGVGKSSLINSINPDLHIKTASISSYHRKGTHTTTFAEMHEISPNSFIVDTPGIREFGIIDIEDAELSHYFKEMQSLIGHCKFNNCLHINEPECAIIAALQEGEIAPERYKSYLSILANEDLYA